MVVSCRRCRRSSVLLGKRFRGSSSRAFPTFIPCSSSRSQPVEASAPSVAVEPIAVIPLVDGGDEKRPSRFSSVRRLGNKDHRWNPRLSDRSAHRAPLRTLGEEFLLLTFMV